MQESIRKVVLISGGSKGLGLGMAEEFGRQGCEVVIAARDAGGLEAARERLDLHGVQVRTEVCDFRDRAQVEALVERLRREMGRIDILVNNAGIITTGPADTMTIEDYEDAMATMFWGVLYPTLAVLPSMKARDTGRIVNITSIGGAVSVPHLLPYNCAKFAARGFSEGLASELKGTGVSVLTVLPGLMRTGSFINAVFKGKKDTEFRWFSLASSTPGLTNDGEVAAKRIVRAALGTETELTLTLPANLLLRLHGVMPGTMVKVLSTQRFILPNVGEAEGQAAMGGGEEKASGAQLMERQGKVFDKALYFGKKAIQRFQP